MAAIDKLSVSSVLPQLSPVVRDFNPAVVKWTVDLFQARPKVSRLWVSLVIVLASLDAVKHFRKVVTVSTWLGLRKV